MLTAWRRASPAVALAACTFACRMSKFLQAHLLRLCKTATSSRLFNPLVSRLTLQLGVIVARAESDVAL
jgi:hypothetical protein